MWEAKHQTFNKPDPNFKFLNFRTHFLSQFVLFCLLLGSHLIQVIPFVLIYECFFFEKDFDK